MALYRYEALNPTGQTVRGTTEAGTPAEARAGLRTNGLHAMRLEPSIAILDPQETPAASTGGWRRMAGHRLDLLAAFSRHLAMLLKSGLPLAQSLNILAEQFEDKAFRDVIQNMSVRVREGASFDQALAVHPKFFPDLYICVTQAGAASGHLGHVLGDLAHYYTRQKRLRDRIVSALTYPALMCAIGLVVLVFLLAFVVPKVTTVLLEQKRALPWPTEVLLFVSGLFQDWWWAIALGVAFLGWCLSAMLRTDQGRRTWDALLLKLPVIGDLIRKQAVARWADTMSNLLGSGIPVAQALAVVRGALGNLILADEVAKLEQGVLEGADMSEILKDSKEMPKSIGFVVGVGQESGELSRVLSDVAASYNEEVDVVSSRLTELVNPILIVFLGLVVGFVVAAILLPITDFANVN
ncbi:MAG: type II secretion system F family protein [Planctomycetes bacterium]|nr:type II secretion system F family protein [Planctomycetota bacterium]